MRIVCLFAMFVVAVGGCGNSHEGRGPDAAVMPGDAGPPDAALADATTGPDAESPPEDASEATLHIHVRANTDPFVHADGLSGQTSRNAYQGVRRMELLTGEGDLDPWVVFDHGDGAVEVGYNDGDDTVIASVPLSGVRRGRYRIGRTVVTHSRYVVDATMHAGVTVDGEFDNVQVLSAGTVIDGFVRPQGWFRYVFRSGGMEFPLESVGAPLPIEPTTTGGFRLAIEGAEAVYYYPLDVEIEPEAWSDDVHLILEVNMDRAFRWQDQALPGYRSGVFDTTPLAPEPVFRFGANSLDVYLE